VGRYVIFYEVLMDGIAVVRILHSARDLGAQFMGGPGEDGEGLE
jgi:plasmid stabilization system protein ParE